MVTFHFIKFKMLAANRAYSILPTISRYFIPFFESTQVEKSARKWVYIAAQQKLIYPLCFLHFIILMQTLYFRAHH